MRKFIIIAMSFLFATVPTFANALEEPIETDESVVEATEVITEEVSEEISEDIDSSEVNEDIAENEEMNEVSEETDEIEEIEEIVEAENVEAEETLVEEVIFEDESLDEDLIDGDLDDYFDEDFDDEEILQRISEALDYYYSTDDEVVYVLPYRIPVEYMDYFGIDDFSFSESDGFIEFIFRDWDEDCDDYGYCTCCIPPEVSEEPTEVVEAESVEEEISEDNTEVSAEPAIITAAKTAPTTPASNSPIGDSGVLILGALAIIIRFLA